MRYFSMFVLILAFLVLFQPNICIAVPDEIELSAPGVTVDELGGAPEGAPSYLDDPSASYPSAEELEAHDGSLLHEVEEAGGLPEPVVDSVENAPSVGASLGGIGVEVGVGEDIVIEQKQEAVEELGAIEELQQELDAAGQPEQLEVIQKSLDSAIVDELGGAPEGAPSYLDDPSASYPSAEELEAHDGSLLHEVEEAGGLPEPVVDSVENAPSVGASLGGIGVEVGVGEDIVIEQKQEAVEELGAIEEFQQELDAAGQPEQLEVIQKSLDSAIPME